MSPPAEQDAKRLDPYHRWLGIPPDQRPPTHYQLLGISPRETDREVIEEAALRQVSHVRTYQTGPHAEQARTLLNEIGQARVALLNPEKRRAYDARLASLASATPPPLPAEEAESSGAVPPPLLPAPELPFVDDEPDQESSAELLTPHYLPHSASLVAPALTYLGLLLIGGVLAFTLGLGPEPASVPTGSRIPGRETEPGDKLIPPLKFPVPAERRGIETKEGA